MVRFGNKPKIQYESAEGILTDLYWDGNIPPYRRYIKVGDQEYVTFSFDLWEKARPFLNKNVRVRFYRVPKYSPRFVEISSVECES